MRDIRKSEPPVLDAYEQHVPGGNPVLRAWCPWCGVVHIHGMPPGLRAAHCESESGSPYRVTGYELRHAGTVTSRRAARPNQAPLEGFLAATMQRAPRLRYHILKGWFPKGRRPRGTAEFDMDLPCGGLLWVNMGSASWQHRTGAIGDGDLEHSHIEC